MNHFCTYFDHRYLGRGLALYHTLKQHCADATLHVLCLSEECESILRHLSFPGLNIVPLAELEAWDHDLLARKDRPQVEYYFTLSPCWPRYVLHSQPNIDVLTYIDADCALFSDPTPVLAEMYDLSVGMVGHRFPDVLQHKIIYGVYNVGWLSFRHDEQGMACLDWWRERCLEWCEDRLDGDRFADQKYLDAWPKLFSRACELTHVGVNVAPWNVERFTFSVQDGTVRVDGQPLVSYHFHGCKREMGSFWRMGLNHYTKHPDQLLRTHVYLPYVRLVQHYDTIAAHLLGRGENAQLNLRYSEKKHGVLKFFHHIRRLLRRNDIVICR